MHRRTKSQERKHISSTPIAVSYKQLTQEKMNYIRTLHEETALLEKELNQYRYIRIYPSQARVKAIEGYQRLINCNLMLIQEEFYKLERLNEMRRENNDNVERVVIYSENPWKVNEIKENSGEKETMESHQQQCSKSKVDKGRFKAEEMQKQSEIRDQNPFDFSGFDFDIEQSEIHECPNDSFDDSMLVLEESTPKKKKKKKKKAKKVKESLPSQAEHSEILTSISHQQLLRPLIEPLNIVPKLDPPKKILSNNKVSSYDADKAKYREMMDSLHMATELYKQENAIKNIKQNIKDYQNGGIKYQDFFRKKGVQRHIKAKI